MEPEGSLQCSQHPTTDPYMVKVSLYLTKRNAMKTYWGKGCIAPCILDLGTRWRRVVSFTPQKL